MSNGRSNQLWLVNIISFILFSILTITGLINWLLLPRGPGAGGGFLISLRHFLRDIHEWAGLVLIITVVIHLFLHWGYIKTNLKRYGLLK
jgi:cytochrome b subunit of formate dehydrogenase